MEKGTNGVLSVIRARQQNRRASRDEVHLNV